MTKIFRSTFLRLALISLAVALVGATMSACGLATKPRSSSDDVQVINNVRYWSGEGRDERQILDIYVPRKGSGWPTAVIVHGGAWVTGGKRYMGNIGYALAENGIAAVCINYRLSPEYRHPAHVTDVARAIAWTKKNLPKYGADTNKVFLIGHSAGGHLVSLVSVKEKYLKDQGLSSNDLAGVMPISGVYEIDTDVLEPVFGSDREKWKDASPIRFVDKGDPPFMILFADNEMKGAIPLVRQAEEFYQELRDAGVEASIHEIDGSNHNTIVGQVGKSGSQTLRLMLRFIDEHS